MRRTDPLSTFVTVGNATQPFDRLLRAVTAAADILPKPIHVQHGVSSLSMPGCLCDPFLGMDEFEERMRSATLVITHAGAGSLMHALDAGQVPIVMPRESRHGEHVDDHQIELAEALARGNRVIVIRSEADLPDAIRRALKDRAAGRQQRTEPALVGMVRERLEEYSKR